MMELFALIALIIGIVAINKASAAHSKIDHLNGVVEQLSKQLHAERKASTKQRSHNTSMP